MSPLPFGRPRRRPPHRGPRSLSKYPRAVHAHQGLSAGRPRVGPSPIFRAELSQFLDGAGAWPTAPWANARPAREVITLKIDRQTIRFRGITPTMAGSPAGSSFGRTRCRSCRVTLTEPGPEDQGDLVRSDSRGPAGPSLNAPPSAVHDVARLGAPAGPVLVLQNRKYFL